MITSSSSFPSHYEFMHPITLLNIEGINLYVIDINYSNNMTYVERIKKFVDFALHSTKVAVSIKKPTIIFATSTPLTIAIPAIISKFYHRKPMVFEVRDLWPEVPIAMGALRNPLLRSLALQLEKLSYHFSDHIVALSSGMKEGIVKVGVPENKIDIIPNSSDIENFQQDELTNHSVIDEIKALNFKHLIIYTGTIGKANEVEYLVKLAAYMRDNSPEIGFIIVGDGAEKPHIISTAKALGILNVNIFIYPPIPKSFMPALYRLSTLTISLVKNIPEMRHNSANKFFDSLAAGRPIVINYLGWQSEVLSESGAGITISPISLASAAISITSLLEDQVKLDNMGKNALKLARTDFDRDKLAAQLNTILLNTSNKI